MMKGITIEVSNKIENNKLERISNKKKTTIHHLNYADLKSYQWKSP